MIAARIRQARLIAGWSQDQLAQQLSAIGTSITKAAISKYETGKSVPSAQMLLQLAQVLKVKSEYFFTEPKLQVEWLAFRRHKTLSVMTQERVKHYAAQVAERQVELQSLLYPDEQPQFPSVRRVHTFDEAEAAALELRAMWQLDDHPIDNLFQTVEDRGGIVVEWREDVGEFDGLAGWGNDSAPVAVINMGVKEDRRRFNLAHELGHLLMDTQELPDKEEELLAHRFAAALLVPAHVVRKELGLHRHQLDWHELGLLKQKYGMSMAAWVYRAKALNIISENYATDLWQEMSSYGWRKTEPYDYIGKEEPSRLKQMTLRAVAEGLISEEQGRVVCPDCFPNPVRTDNKGYLSARDLLKLPLEERNKLVAEMLSKSADEDIEIFEANGNDDFDDEYTATEYYQR
ncbi:MAG: ImmA/IrrE family metallo-endopeptidase [Chloroflexi bacterium]|nr:ImmA/IrrE family metallo-endopeptidase [Chloroflexota bacterium]